MVGLRKFAGDSYRDPGYTACTIERLAVLMETIELTARVSASRAAVCEYVLDFINSTTWNPAIVSLHHLMGDGSTGTVYYGRRRWDDAEIFVVYTVEEHRAGSHLRVAGHTDSFISDLTIRVDDRLDLVEVTVVEDMMVEVDASFTVSPAQVTELSDALALSLSGALASL